VCRYVNPGDTGEFEKPMGTHEEHKGCDNKQYSSLYFTEVGGLNINIRVDVPYSYNWKASSKTSKVDTYNSFRVANVIVIVYSNEPCLKEFT
jgi:hypothetical protein